MTQKPAKTTSTGAVIWLHLYRKLRRIEGFVGAIAPTASAAGASQGHGNCAAMTKVVTD